MRPPEGLPLLAACLLETFSSYCEYGRVRRKMKGSHRWNSAANHWILRWSWLGFKKKNGFLVGLSLKKLHQCGSLRLIIRFITSLIWPRPQLKRPSRINRWPTFNSDRCLACIVILVFLQGLKVGRGGCLPCRRIETHAEKLIVETIWLVASHKGLSLSYYQWTTWKIIAFQVGGSQWGMLLMTFPH